MVEYIRRYFRNLFRYFVKSDLTLSDFERAKKALSNRKKRLERTRKILVKVKDTVQGLVKNREVLYFCVAVQFGLYVIKTNNATHVAVADYRAEVVTLQKDVTIAISDLRTEIVRVEKDLTKEISKVRASVKEESGVQGSLKRVGESGVSFLLTSGAIKLGHMGSKVLVKRVQLGRENKNLKTEITQLKEDAIYSENQLAAMQAKVDDLNSEKEILLSGNLSFEDVDFNDLQFSDKSFSFKEVSIVLSDSDLGQQKNSEVSEPFLIRFREKLKKLNHDAGKKIAPFFENAPFSLQAEISLTDLRSRESADTELKPQEQSEKTDSTDTNTKKKEEDVRVALFLTPYDAFSQAYLHLKDGLEPDSDPGYLQNNPVKKFLSPLIYKSQEGENKNESNKVIDQVEEFSEKKEIRDTVGEFEQPEKK